MWLGCSAETSHDLESNDLACRGPHEQPTTEAPVGAANTLLAAPTGSTEPRAVVSCSCGPEQGFPEEGTNHRFPNHVLLVIASARSVRKLPVCASGMPCMGALYACALGALYAYAMGARQT